MSKKLKTTEFNPAEWCQDHPQFLQWWRKHRNSGYCEDNEGYSHWGISPWEAWRVDAFRSEYSLDGGTPYKSKNHYSEEEKLRWTRDQKEAEQMAKEFGFGYNCEENARLRKMLGPLTDIVKLIMNPVAGFEGDPHVTTTFRQNKLEAAKIRAAEIEDEKIMQRYLKSQEEQRNQHSTLLK